MRVVLVAGEAAGLQALKLLAASEHRVVAVLTTPDEGRGASVAGAAARLAIPVEEPALVRDPGFAERLERQCVDLLLNVHSLHVARPEVVEAPRIGSFNLHPGPLPEYSGLNAPSWAIYNGEPHHGVTVHWMAPEVDAGPIAYEASFELEPEETGLSASAKCVRHGLPLIARLLEDAQAGRVPRREQDLARRRWYGREAPHGGRLPWSLPAERIAALVRAADYSPFPSPWGHPKASLGGREIEVVRAARTGEPSSEPPGTVGAGARVAAADEWVLLERLRADGRARDPAQMMTAGDRFDVTEGHG